MATTDSSAPAHPSTEDHDDTVEAHYAALERACHCYGSGVVVIAIEEDGQDREETVPCRHCADSR
jgi:hypothetical protein